MKNEFQNEKNVFLFNNQNFHILNPRLDPNFKAIFTQPTPESRCALKSFLTAAIGRKVVDVTVVENEEPKASLTTEHWHKLKSRARTRITPSESAWNIMSHGSQARLRVSAMNGTNSHRHTKFRSWIFTSTARTTIRSTTTRWLTPVTAQSFLAF